MAFQFSLKICLTIAVVSVVMAVVSASVVEQYLKVPLFEIGGLWMKALQDLVTNIHGFILTVLQFTSFWSYFGAALTLYILYRAYFLVFGKMNRVRALHEIGYITEGKISKKDMCEMIKKKRKIGDCPPCYPNGWFSVIDSHDLKVNEAKSVSCLGLNLAVFRGSDSRAHVVDAYCPHLGANLAVGGRVVGNCIQCPFHGWTFSGDSGKCTHIPTTDKIPDVARVKSYHTLERNGFVYIWYHAEGIEPTWTPPEIEEIPRGDWAYLGRTEHHVNAHIEEVPENGADIAHLPQLHGPLLPAGVDIRYMYSKLWDFGKHQWNASWEQFPDPDRHIGALRLRHSLRLFGYNFTMLDMDVVARQIGPGIVYLTFDSLFGRGAYLQSLTPVEPLVQKMVHQVWFDWWVPPIIGKFFLLAEALMIERDIMIWNNKQYNGKPVLIKGPEDHMLQKHRRWYSQFYSENSPTIQSLRKKESLDW